MRRLVSIVLALVMALALTVPTLAAEDPLWQQMGYESLAECLEDNEITEAQYNEIAPKAAGFDPEAYWEIKRTDPIYEIIGGSIDYKELFGDDPEEFRRFMLEDWFWEEASAYSQQNFIDGIVRELGGTPGQINVMVDGTCIPFKEVFPVIESGRTMVPLRDAMEFLGAKVDYDKTTHTASVAGEDIAFTHVIGTDTLTMADGTAVTMDVASAVQNGSTLVPLRFFSQALGYDLYWDKELRCAVVFDAEKVAAEIDKDFTIFNSFLAKQYEGLDYTKPLLQKITFSVDEKLLDSIDGDKTGRISGELEALQDAGAVNISGRVDLSGAVRLIERELETVDEALSPELLRQLTPLTFDMIAAGDEVFLRSPALSYMGGLLAGVTIPSGAWIASSGIGDTLSELAAQYAALAEMQPVTLGRVLCGAAVMEGGAEAYQEIGQMAQLFQLLIGDETWTRSGSVYKWHFGQAELEKLSEALGYGQPYYSPYYSTDYTIDMALRSDGSCDFSMEMSSSGYAGIGSGKVVIKGTIAPGRAQFTGRVQSRNTSDISFRVDTTIKAGSKVPVQAPPEGALVLREADFW